MAREKMTAARAMVKCLQAEGIKHIFGYPGAAICPFFNEIPDSDIKNILVRHEVNAGHAASGYARISGKPAVCVATSGPGATNLLTAIATAHMDSIPLVAITGQVICEQIGRDAFQEADITGAAEPFVKHSFLVKNAGEICEIMKKAFYIAGSGRPGPVLIDVPMDIQNEQVDFAYPDKVEIRSYKPNVVGNKLQLKKVVTALEKSKRPLICAGGGVFLSNSQQLLRELSEKCDIPVVSSMMGIGCIPTGHRNYFGMIGMYGKKLANKAIGDCDLLIILGARADDRAVAMLKATKNVTVVHIDIDPAEIGKNVMVNIPVVGDINNILEQIISAAGAHKHEKWFRELNAQREPENGAVSAETGKGVNPKLFMQALNSRLSDRAVISADVGQNQIWAANNIAIDKGRFLTSGGMGTMGYSLPAAIGAKIADETAEVICICGDGSFQMQSMELATAIQHGVNVKIVVMVNNYLGMIRELQDESYGGREVAVELGGSPDFIRLAEAYGIEGESVRSDKETEKAVKNMIKSPKPYLLQVFVDEKCKSIID